MSTNALLWPGVADQSKPVQVIMSKFNIYVVPTFFLLFSFTFLFEDFYYSVKEYKKISVCCSSG